MDNRFENQGKDQNVAQGDRPIGKQVNITQHVTGTNNFVTGTGDIHLPPSPVIPRQLPYLDACFLGRDKELAELIEQLHPGKVVAVCGPGGMGKSALAAQAVHQLEEDRFPDGVVFHTFYHKPGTDEALQTIAEAFQIEVKTGLETAVKGVLAGKKALLILDGAEEAKDLKAVLDLRSTCGVLITSRKRSDAQKLRLDLKPLKEKPAADVFCEYSGAVADDVNVQGICTILDGWPVGLRIAGRYVSSTGESTAAYLRWLEQEPFKELGDGEAHQEENAALLLARSVTQVGEDARLALGLAGTLAFAPLAHWPVAAMLDFDERRTRRALNELVKYGLLEKQEKRWQTSHALIHTYARSKLPLSRDALERLVKYYIFFCILQSQAGLKGYVHLDGERGHCLRLMEACLASKLWQEIKFLEGAIWEYLDRQGWWTESLAALEMRLTAARKTGNRKNEGKCLNSLGCTCDRFGEHDKALVWYKQSLPIRCELGDRQGEGATLNNIAMNYWYQGKYALSLQTFQQSLSIAREVSDQKGEGTALNNIGLLYSMQGDNEQALPYLVQCLPLRQEAGDQIGVGRTLNNIATIYRAQGKPAKALEYHEQALAIYRKLGARAGEAEFCWNIGLTYEKLGDLAKAEEYMTLAVDIEEAIGHPDLETYRDGLKQVRAVRRGV